MEYTDIISTVFASAVMFVMVYGTSQLKKVLKRYGAKLASSNQPI